jgi:YHS domain-containing protein
MKGTEMKKIFLFTLIVLLSLSFSINAQDKGSKKVIKEVKKEKVSDNKPVNTICPVSSEDADPEITYTYEGRTYAVCCKKCLKKIQTDPEKYISRLSDDGKSIKKKK